MCALSCDNEMCFLLRVVVKKVKKLLVVIVNCGNLRVFHILILLVEFLKILALECVWVHIEWVPSEWLAKFQLLHLGIVG